MSLKNPTWVGTECDLGFSPGAPGEGRGRLQQGLDPGCALSGSASCWQETARAADAATGRVGADTRPTNLGGATAGREVAASPRLDLPFGGSETCSALTQEASVLGCLLKDSADATGSGPGQGGWTWRLEAWSSGLNT